MTERTDRYVLADPVPWRVMERTELIQRLKSIAEMHDQEAAGVRCRACMETYPCASRFVATGGKEPE